MTYLSIKMIWLDITIMVSDTKRCFFLSSSFGIFRVFNGNFVICLFSALSTRIIERIFSGCVTKTAKANNQRMSYTEFVWFLLSEEDKSHATAVEYWFR